VIARAATAGGGPPTTRLTSPGPSATQGDAPRLHLEGVPITQRREAEHAEGCGSAERQLAGVSPGGVSSFFLSALIVPSERWPTGSDSA